MAERAPSEPDIFLSYAREDQTRARELATALEERGFAVFWDRDIPPGQTWHSYIGEALTNARCVMVAWSRHSIASQWVLEEASEGRDRNVLVPVLLEAVLPPFGFRAIQAANLVDWRLSRPSPAFDSLLGAVQRVLGGRAGSGIEAGTELAPPPRPESWEPVRKTKPTVRPATPSPARSEPRAEPVKSSYGQASAWSRPAALATLMGFVVIAGAGGAAVFWWRTQPEPTTSEPATEAERSIPPSAPSESTVEAESRTATPASSRSKAGEPRVEMRDCPECPEMVLAPSGGFKMGSPPRDRDADEGPQRDVAIAEPFWAGKYEVTFAEWDACAAVGGCSHKPDDAGWGRDNRPVINVSWSDAKEYVGWLSQKTGKAYRLLSEAEWEYVARAGSKSAFWWGDVVGKGNANCDGCDSEDNTKTAPVGSFRANDFGLYDTAGNVWEWVEDCYHERYEGAPTDGSPWLGDCASRVLRGGSWLDVPRRVRSANRFGNYPRFRSNS